MYEYFLFLNEIGKDFGVECFVISASHHSFIGFLFAGCAFLEKKALL
jgi:hypothetical protein